MISRISYTLDFLDKKHVKFDQGLDFLIFYEGKRGKDQEKPRKNNKQLRKKRGKGPYFLFHNFLFKQRSVEFSIIIFRGPTGLPSSGQVKDCLGSA